MSENLRNWAGNFEYSSRHIHRPKSVAEVQEIVRRATKVRALATRHSFNDIADTDGEMISTEHLNQTVVLDPERRRVTVDAGSTYGRLCPRLDAMGFAVHNLASLPHISVAGACATATHGSGDKNGNLATVVSAVEIVTADGSLLTLHRDHHADEFAGAGVSLGGLGVVVRVTLDVEPSFLVAQEVFTGLPFSELEGHFDKITSSAYSVSVFTDWRTSKFNQIWFKHRVPEGAGPKASSYGFGATRATEKLHPIKEMSAVNCTEQMGIPGPSFERLPHFRMDFTPSSGAELQSEYLIPRTRAIDALRAIMALQSRISPLLLVSEIRTIAADNLWMSPCYGQACVGVHFTWKPDWPAVSKLLPVIEAELEPFDARPHWGKLFTTSPDRIASLYERLPAFRRLLQAHDPQGKFRNPFLDRYVFP